MNKNIRIGTNFSPFIKRNGLKDTIVKIAKTGFDAAEFSLGRLYGVDGLEGEKEFFSDIRKLAQDLNLELCQAHSPFERTDLSSEYFLSDEYFSRQVMAIRRASILNIPYLVVHPYTPYLKNPEQEKYDYSKLEKHAYSVNLNFFERLRPYFADYGVKCAIENLVEYDFVTRSMVKTACSTSKELNSLINDLGKDLFCACFDCGHANLVKGEGLKEFIENLGDNLKCLHLNDNFGALNDWFGELDRHLPPFYGCVNWEEIKQGLNNIGYSGVYNFECINYMQSGEFDQVFADYILKSGKHIFAIDR